MNFSFKVSGRREGGRGDNDVRPEVAVFPRFRAGPHSFMHWGIY